MTISLPLKVILQDSANAHTRVRMTECHDWSYLNFLWKRNETIIFRTMALNFAIYIGLAYWTTYADGDRGVDNMYLITATLTTVCIHMNNNSIL
jgi:hypothetical protein